MSTDWFDNLFDFKSEIDTTQIKMNTTNDDIKQITSESKDKKKNNDDLLDFMSLFNETKTNDKHVNIIKKNVILHGYEMNEYNNSFNDFVKELFYVFSQYLDNNDLNSFIKSCKDIDINIKNINNNNNKIINKITVMKRFENDLNDRYDTFGSKYIKHMESNGKDTSLMFLRMYIDNYVDGQNIPATVHALFNYIVLNHESFSKQKNINKIEKISIPREYIKYWLNNYNNNDSMTFNINGNDINKNDTNNWIYEGSIFNHNNFDDINVVGTNANDIKNDINQFLLPYLLDTVYNDNKKWYILDSVFINNNADELKFWCLLLWLSSKNVVLLGSKYN